MKNVTQLRPWTINEGSSCWTIGSELSGANCPGGASCPDTLVNTSIVVPIK